jgi:hypothetical protein
LTLPVSTSPDAFAICAVVSRVADVSSSAEKIRFRMDVSLAWLYDPEQPAIIPFHFASNQRFFKAYGQSLLISGLLT